MPPLLGRSGRLRGSSVPSTSAPAGNDRAIASAVTDTRRRGARRRPRRRTASSCHRLRNRTGPHHDIPRTLGHVLVDSPDGTVVDVGPRGFATLSLFSRPLALGDAIERLEGEERGSTDFAPMMGVINVPTRRASPGWPRSRTRSRPVGGTAREHRARLRCSLHPICSLRSISRPQIATVSCAAPSHHETWVIPAYNRIRASAQSVKLVETVGIEPTSAIAHEVASTSVSGALFSSRSRLAGGVLRDQPPEDVPGLAEADRPG